MGLTILDACALPLHGVYEKVRRESLCGKGASGDTQLSSPLSVEAARGAEHSLCNHTFMCQAALATCIWIKRMPLPNAFRPDRSQPVHWTWEGVQ